MPRLVRLLGLLLTLTACGESEPASMEPSPAPAEEVEIPSDQRDQVEPLEPAEEEPVGPVLDDNALDAMDEPALQAACFEGSTAACDRLGH